VVILSLLLKKRNENPENELVKILMESTKTDRNDITGRLDKMDEKIYESLNNSTKTIQNQFFQHREIIKEVSGELERLKETNKQVLNFSEKLQSLENILKSPKKRGVLGEFYLETLLSNILPGDLYKMQYKFKNGEIVDAVIFFQEKIIPIDSKFSLENFNLIETENDEVKKTELIKKFNIDLKNRIEETSKYIRPEENTTDFAFMFIPAEGIYVSLLNYNSKDSITSGDIISMAFKKHVIIVSPISFYAYLQTVLQGLKSLKIEASVKEILKKTLELSKDIEKYEESFSRLGKQLETTVKTYNIASNRFKKIDKDLYKLSDGKKENLLSPYTIDTEE
jgi:DNA recombination protein RmuC